MHFLEANRRPWSLGGGFLCFDSRNPLWNGTHNCKNWERSVFVARSIPARFPAPLLGGRRGKQSPRGISQHWLGPRLVPLERRITVHFVHKREHMHGMSLPAHREVLDLFTILDGILHTPHGCHHCWLDQGAEGCDSVTIYVIGRLGFKWDKVTSNTLPHFPESYRGALVISSMALPRVAKAPLSLSANCARPSRYPVMWPFNLATKSAEMQATTESHTYHGWRWLWAKRGVCACSFLLGNLERTEENHYGMNGNTRKFYGHFQWVCHIAKGYPFKPNGVILWMIFQELWEKPKRYLFSLGSVGWSSYWFHQNTSSYIKL